MDYRLYLNIWSLQDMFRYPTQCYNQESWDKFTEVILLSRSFNKSCLQPVTHLTFADNQVVVLQNADNVFRVFQSYKLEETCSLSKPASSRQPKYNSCLSWYIKPYKHFVAAVIAYSTLSVSAPSTRCFNLPCFSIYKCFLKISLYVSHQLLWYQPLTPAP